MYTVLGFLEIDLTDVYHLQLLGHKTTGANNPVNPYVFKPGNKMAVFTPKDVSYMAKFDGSNFWLWKFQISINFEQHDLMGVVCGTETLPFPKEEAQIKKDRDDKDEEGIKQWKKKDNSVRLFIVSTIEQHWQRTLINCKTANEMWVRLTNQHEEPTSENKPRVQQKFFEYRFQQGNDIMNHITDIETMANQLSDLGAPVSELQIITKINCTLPPSF